MNSTYTHISLNSLPEHRLRHFRCKNAHLERLRMKKKKIKSDRKNKTKHVSDMKGKRETLQYL